MKLIAFKKTLYKGQQIQAGDIFEAGAREGRTMILLKISGEAPTVAAVNPGKEVTQMEQRYERNGGRRAKEPMQYPARKTRDQRAENPKGKRKRREYKRRDMSAESL